ncbi:MAG: hypothetical protein PHP85_12925, partial [Gallionella sp.]|nr:hypothetical protein [Gallionella sp.]
IWRLLFGPGAAGATHAIRDDSYLKSICYVKKRRIPSKSRPTLHWEEGGYFIVGEARKLEKLMTTLGFEGLRATPEANSHVDFWFGYGSMAYCENATIHKIIRNHL